MKRGIALTALTVSVLMTAACSSSGSSALSATVFYTVRFVDDSSEHNDISYQYVRYGHAISLPIADFDGSSKAESLPTVGTYRVFSAWAGTYATASSSYSGAPSSGEAVNVNSIKGNCTLTATFEEDPYKIAAKFFNENGEFLRDEDGNVCASTVEWGGLPQFPNLTPTQNSVSYGHVSTFQGYYLQKDSALNSIAPADMGAATFSYGVGAPGSLSKTEGSYYVDVTVSGDARLYEVYSRVGSGWVDLGALSSSALSVSYVASYADSLASYPVKLYSDSSMTTLLDTLYADYGTSLAIATDLTSGLTSASSASGSASFTLTIPLGTNSVTWKGVFDAGDNPYSERPVDSQKRIVAAASFYPLFV
jgi:hypothetical protein